MIAPTIRDLADPDNMMKRLRSRADEMAPTMRFLATVCGSKRYKDEIEPYVYMTIAVVINYVIFDGVSFVLPQIKMVKDEIKKLIKEQDNKTDGVQS